MPDTLTPRIELNIPDDAWIPADENNGDHKLIYGVNLNGQATLYLEAFEVTLGSENEYLPIPAMGSDFVSQFWEALKTFSGDGPEHMVTIKGRDYVVFACPGRD